MGRLFKKITDESENRILGLAHASFYGWIAYEVLNSNTEPQTLMAVIPIGAFLVADGLVDLVTGEHRYLPMKAINYITGEKNSNDS